MPIFIEDKIMNWFKDKWEKIKKWIKENSGYQQHEWPPPYFDPYIYFPPYYDPHVPYFPPPRPINPPDPIPPFHPHPNPQPHPFRPHRLNLQDVKLEKLDMTDQEKAQWWYDHFQTLANHFGYESDEIWFTRDTSGKIKVQGFKRIIKPHSLLCDEQFFGDLLTELYKRREEIAKLLKVLNQETHELRKELADIEKRIQEYEGIKI